MPCAVCHACMYVPCVMRSMFLVLKKSRNEKHFAGPNSLGATFSLRTLVRALPSLLFPFLFLCWFSFLVSCLFLMFFGIKMCAFLCLFGIARVATILAFPVQGQV